MSEQFQKTYCLYHPNESITNFQSCLMPLCPTCICTHLQLHVKEGKSIPQFDNINDSLNNCYKDIKEYSNKIEQSRLRLNSIQRSINQKKKDLADLLYNAKVQVRQLVDNSFTQLQKQLETLKLHLPEYINDVQKSILDTNSKIRQMLIDLKSESSLGTLITYHHEAKVSTQKTYQQIALHIKNNEEYYPIATLNHQAINRIKQNILQIINLKFNFPTSISSKTQIGQRDNYLVNQQADSTNKMHSPSFKTNKSPLNKIPNTHFTSPNRVSNNHKHVSPSRHTPKSLITHPTVPRISMDGLPILSQLNP